MRALPLFTFIAATSAGLLFGAPADAETLCAAPDGDGYDPVGVVDGSCLTVFRNQTGLAGFPSDAALVDTVVANCGLPQGPYRRNGTDKDYFLIRAKTPNNLPKDYPLTATEINDQIGTTLPSGHPDVSVRVVGTVTNQDAQVSLTQTSGGKSQIIDLPGFEFVLFLKSSGGGAQVATLVCDPKIWYTEVTNATADTDFVYGLKDFALDHSVNEIVIGFAAGPSGAGNQAAAEGICTAANAAGGLEKFVTFVAGGYKVTPTAPENPVNFTACKPPDEPQPFANHCDATEAPGTFDANTATATKVRPSACNASGQAGGAPQVDVSLVNGANSVSTWSRGTYVGY